jgi:hypothetical protein
VSLFAGLACVASLGILPAACQSGGVGDPCIPEDEYSPEFSGFDPAEENIESRSFQCETRICLVNHFQGRVSCPLGQEPPRACNPASADACASGEQCVEVPTVALPCEPEVADAGASQCASSGGTCDPLTRTCVCDESSSCAEGFSCDLEARRCKRYICHAPGACQSASATGEQNAGKACCVPGTDTPTTASVCGQCAASSDRGAERAVYCSCRCGPPEGAPPDDSFNYCACPSGFECKEIRKYYGFGDEQLAGKYCIKQGSEFEGKQECGAVNGYFDPGQCAGIASNL